MIEGKELFYEIGPIRPPSEAYSLLVRFTRNCPWNKCTFCNLYKKTRFQKRTIDEIKQDIDTIKSIHDHIKEMSGGNGCTTRSLAEEICMNPSFNECYKSVAVWMYFGGKNVFIQDAHSLAMNPEAFLECLTYLKETFPGIERITCYARARTIAERLSVEDLIKMRSDGLTRLHVGFESGSDRVLAFMKKGVTKAQQIECGQKVKASGIELSEYIVLGLGGKTWSEEHAKESADAINRIDPDYIRMRTLTINRRMPLYEKIQSGDFPVPDPEDLLHEERLFIENLNNISSTVKSDHMLNLLEEVDGRLPGDKEKILSVIDRYFELSDEERLVFQFGRRSGTFRSTDDLRDIAVFDRIKKRMKEMNSRTPGKVEKILSILHEDT
ncbi:MAG TPA: radical SAM protein [Syntrophorhabdaceae bacterium]|jgi:radical SAM superfamily enzyme YgiQ (UPF0313 family)